MVMVYPKKKKSLRPKNRRVRRRVGVTRAKPSKALRKMVQQVVSRNIENKSRQANSQMYCRYPAQGNNYQFLGLFPLTPYDSTGTPADSTISIIQGTGAGSRIGNTIRTKYATLKGVFSAFPEDETYNPSPKPVDICMWIFKMKDFQSGNQIGNANNLINSDFFQSSNTTTAVTGDLINLVQAINTDRVYLLYKRVFKIGYAAGNSSGNIANNDYKYNQFVSLNITKMLPKVVKYNDSDEDPSINHVYCLVLPFRADGSVDTGDTRGCKFDWEINYVYEDA